MTRSSRSLRLETDRPIVLRQCHPGLPQGRHGIHPRRLRRLLDKIPFGAAFGKGLTFKMGQTHMHTLHEAAARPHREGRHRSQLHHLAPRLSTIDVPEMYDTWLKKQDHVTKIVIDPWAEPVAA